MQMSRNASATSKVVTSWFYTAPTPIRFEEILVRHIKSELLVRVIAVLPLSNQTLHCGSSSRYHYEEVSPLIM